MPENRMLNVLIEIVQGTRVRGRQSKQWNDVRKWTALKLIMQ